MFQASAAAIGEPVIVPCRKCLACVRALGLSWGYRCWHESLQHDASSFLTLTYDDEHYQGKLVLHDCQTFLKRLRKWMSAEQLVKLRYFLVGEYGEATGRAHYHMIVFGEDFLAYSERTGFNSPDDDYYFSAVLQSLWGNGSVHLSPLNVARSLYAASHAVKAFGTDRKTFRLASKVPPIGIGWLEKYWEDFSRLGFGTADGQKYAIPQHYLNWWWMQERFATLREKRMAYVEALPEARRNPSQMMLESSELNLRAKIALKRGKL